jgi:hypothetical protein
VDTLLPDRRQRDCAGRADGVQPVRSWASRGVVMLIGLTVIAIGNLLPRTRPNSRSAYERHEH